MRAIESFKNHCQWLVKRMTGYEERNDGTVYVYLDDDSTILYDMYTHVYKYVKRFEKVSELTGEEWTLGFADRLTKHIELSGLTQSEIAAAIDISPVTLNRYIHGKNSPGLYVLHKLARVLDCNTDDLLPKDHIFISNPSR